MEVTYLDGSDKGKMRWGIYVLEDDMVKACLSEADRKELPMELASKPGSRQISFVARREQP